MTRRRRDPRGVTAIATGGFEAEVAAIRAEFGDLPMLMAGMVGSTIGWRAAPYVPVPAGLEEIARGLLHLDDRTAIVPGVSTLADGRADVMRGEETQALGAIAAGLVPPDALLCLPGTHCKWVRVERGRIAGFTTAMTGELFALLRDHSVLAAQLAAPVAPGDAFLAGVAEGRRRDFAASLFGVRASSLLGVRVDAEAAAFASGVLIGGDVAARLEASDADTVHILAEPALAALYAQAIESHGRRQVILDAEAAFVAAMIVVGSRT